MNTQTLLTVEEAADLLRVDKTTVRRWLRQDKLKGIRIGKAWRLRAADIHDLVEQPKWFVASAEALNGVTALGESSTSGDARQDLNRYWSESFR